MRPSFIRGWLVVAVMVLSSGSVFAQCANGVCQRPVVNTVKSAATAVVQSAPVQAVVHAQPIQTIVHSQPVQAIVHSCPVQTVVHSKPVQVVTKMRPVQYLAGKFPVHPMSSFRFRSCDDYSSCNNR